MYHLFKIEIKYNSYSKILNNLTYMYAMNMILHSFWKRRKKPIQWLKIALVESLVKE
jgi:hypothetical protein